MGYSVLRAFKIVGHAHPTPLGLVQVAMLLILEFLLRPVNVWMAIIRMVPFLCISAKNALINVLNVHGIPAH